MKRLFVVLIAIVSLSACDVAVNPYATPYAARISGDGFASEVVRADVIDDEIDIVTSNPVSMQDLEQQLLSSGGLRPGGDNTISSQYTSNVLYTRILAALFENEIDRLDIVVTPEQRVAAEQSLRQSPQQSEALDGFPADYRNYLIERQANLDALLAARATPEAIAAFYESNRDALTPNCVRQILVETTDQAAAIRARIANGEDFAAVANEVATQQAQQPDGGELGCFANSELSQLVQPFADAVRVLPVGELSQPVQTQFGFHVIQVTSRNLASLADSTEQIREQIASPTTLLFDLLEGKEIEVNPRYGEFVPGDRASNTPGQIVPLRSSGLTPDPDPDAQAADPSGLPPGLQQP